MHDADFGPRNGGFLLRKEELRVATVVRMRYETDARRLSWSRA